MKGAPIPELLNTAGEPERERRSRRWNLVEGVGVMVVILAALWWIAYPFGVLGGAKWAQILSGALLWGVFINALFLSPWVHGDTMASRGLGNPRWVWGALTHGPAAQRWAFGVLLAVLTLFLAVMLFRNAEGAGKFLLGIPRQFMRNLQSHSVGQALVFATCLLFCAAWTVCIVRYDNFLSSLAAAAKIIAVLLPVVLLGGLAVNGPSAFADFDAPKLALNALGYVFWGAIQQLLFCSFFGTRLRKGFGPAPALTSRRRLLVALLTGSFFGLIHINSWLLVAATWVLGSFLSWCFMQDRYRNLFALGAVHGVLGTCLGWLFHKGKGLHISLRVGPWWMRDYFDPVTLVVSTAVIVGLAMFLFVALRREGEKS